MLVTTQAAYQADAVELSCATETRIVSKETRNVPNDRANVKAVEN
jgi:hypothetical protein